MILTLKICIDFKPKKVFEDNLNKPTIVFINNAFIRVRNHDTLTSDNTAMILLDECHSISAKQTYQMLEKLKYDRQISIIGFSATPLRDKAGRNLINIFSKTFNRNEKPELNIISIYDYLHALKDDIILPFMIHYVEIDKKQKDNDIEKMKIIKKILNDVRNDLPYQKYIAWCGTIMEMKNMYHCFKKTYPEYKIYMTSSMDKTFEDNYNCNYDEYCREDSNCILLCVNRCREGVDIYHADCGMYLDIVKDRSILVSLQKGGRMMRPDKERRKKRAVIIDIFCKIDGKSVEALTVHRIMDYYLRILNLTSTETYDYNEHRELYKKICELRMNTIFDDEKNMIRIAIDDDKKHDTKIHIKTRTIDWIAIKEYLRKEMDRKFNVSRDNQFDEIMKTIRESGEMDLECDFWNVYENMKNDYGLPIDFYNEFKDKFEKNFMV